METSDLIELLSNNKLSEVKKIIQDMNEFDIANLIEELPSE